MADNDDMKTNLLIIASFIFLVSCNPKEESGSVSYRVASGALTKAWVANDSGSKMDSIDLSNPNNIVVINLEIKVPNGPATNGVPAPTTTLRSDCTYSSASQTVLSDMTGSYEMALLTGNPIVCNQLIPIMYYRHYGFADSSNEFMAAGGVLFR